MSEDYFIQRKMKYIIEFERERCESTFEREMHLSGNFLMSFNIQSNRKTRYGRHAIN